MNTPMPRTLNFWWDCKSGSIRLFFVEAAILDVDPGETNVYDGEKFSKIFKAQGKGCYPYPG